MQHIVCTGIQLLTKTKDHVINVLSQDGGNGRLDCKRCAHIDDNTSLGYPKLVILLVPESCAWTFINQMGTRLGLEEVA